MQKRAKTRVLGGQLTFDVCTIRVHSLAGTCFFKAAPYPNHDKAVTENFVVRSGAEELRLSRQLASRRPAGRRRPGGACAGHEIGGMTTESTVSCG